MQIKGLKPKGFLSHLEKGKKRPNFRRQLKNSSKQRPVWLSIKIPNWNEKSKKGRNWFLPNFDEGVEETNKQNENEADDPGHDVSLEMNETKMLS